MFGGKGPDLPWSHCPAALLGALIGRLPAAPRYIEATQVTEKALELGRASCSSATAISGSLGSRPNCARLSATVLVQDDEPVIGVLAGSNPPGEDYRGWRRECEIPRNASAGLF